MEKAKELSKKVCKKKRPIQNHPNIWKCQVVLYVWLKNGELVLLLIPSDGQVDQQKISLSSHEIGQDIKKNCYATSAEIQV